MNYILAQIFNFLKAQSPKVYGLFMVALMTLVYFAQKASFFGLFTVAPDVANALTLISAAILGLSGTHTTEILKNGPPD